MKSLPINRPTLDDPVYSQKNPHQTFLLAFSLVASLPVLVGGESPSRALANTVGPGVVKFWALTLLIGSIIALIGEFWRGHTWDSLWIERAGLALVGAGGAFYSMVLWFTVGAEAGYVVGITGAYALSCLWRVGQITHRLAWIRELVDDVNRHNHG